MDLVEQWLPWVLGGLLVALGVTFVVVLRVRALRADQELAAVRRAHQGELQQVQQSRDRELAHQRGIFQQEEGRLRADADRLAKDLNRVFDWAASGMRWEWASREAILDACLQLGVDGVLATNVVFVPGRNAGEDPVFPCQMDHVLITPVGLLVIESKRWKGLIFDGVSPSSVWRPLGVVIDESQLPEPCAIHIWREADNGLGMRLHTGDRHPARQVRQQAARLREFLDTVVGTTPWVETCVFYSHPDAVVHAGLISRSQRGATTRVVATVEQLKAAIEALGSDNVNSGEQWFRASVELLRSLGADAYGLGRYATEWTSTFPRGWADDPRAERIGIRNQRRPDVVVSERPEPTVVLADATDVEHTVVLPVIGGADEDTMPDPLAGPDDQPTARMPGH